ncbi:ATP-dependent helicase [Acidithiobacillus thiooxidans]|uniref:ATP-dependent helicase n=1 Tax=Acidithiobacillus thiooxidans TaxID=930 RepID=UPI000553388A|nr:ATP-dependent helicase [Acidithiobacillus thiooxidans]
MWQKTVFMTTDGPHEVFSMACIPVNPDRLHLPDNQGLPMQLNDEQKLAVDHEGHLLLLAGAGSGKTLVLAHRAANLLKHGDGNLVAVTFTHDSAAELKRRILRLSPGHEKRIRTGTFHALAMMQLRAVGREIKLLNNGDRNRLIVHALSLTEEDIPFEEMSKIIDKVKSELEHRDYSGMGYKTYHAYQELLRKDRRMDFADLLTEAIDGMRDGSIGPHPMRWLMGDEFQDTDEAQYSWLMMQHELTGAEMTMVGDDDQSIYSFRHALGYAGMERFQVAVQARIRHLSNNYRCAPEILQPAGRLIHHNTYRAEKRIQAASDSGGMIECLYPRDREEESEWFIERYREDRSGWAVLSRTNRLLDVLEIALQQEGIPYFRDSDDDFWSLKEPRALLTMLAGIMEGGKALALPTGTGKGSHLLGKTALEKRKAHSRSQLMAGCRAALYLCGWKAAVTDGLLKRLESVALPEWKPVVDEWAKAQEVEGVKKTRKMSSGLRFMEYLPGWCTVSIQDPVLLIEGLQRWNAGLLPSVSETCEIALGSIARLRGTLSQRLQFIERLAQKKEESTPDLGPDTVILTTMHGSKGLEWEKVWVLGVEDGVVPHLDGEMEEERRLFYVAMTRAKRRLVLSSVREGRPSPFLVECGIQDNG